MIAGHRRPVPVETMTVDYADVMRQAVVNERATAFRHVRQTLEMMPTTKPSGRNAWETLPRTAAEFKADLITALNRMEDV